MCSRRTKPVCFVAGQPLEDVMATLCHHKVIWYAAEQVYVFPGMGDDVVLADEQVAKQYSSLVTEGLGLLFPSSSFDRRLD